MRFAANRPPRVPERRNQGRPADGEVLTLPPNPDAFTDAKPGIYRLRSTGEEVVDPDLTTVWTIREPPNEHA